MKWYILFLSAFLTLYSCTSNTPEEITDPEEEFAWEIDRFADVRILRYQVPGFDRLTLDQKKLVYYLTQAGLAGRDIMYDMNYRHNLEIRKVLEAIILNYEGDKSVDAWQDFMTYAKRVWFANGIHHHYSMQKFKPGFKVAYFDSLCDAAGVSISDDAKKAIFDPSYDNKKVNLDPSRDLLLASAVNFYAPDVSAQEASDFYTQKSQHDGPEPVSHGLNSRLVKDTNGQLIEEVYSLNGKYGDAIAQIISWLEKAVSVAENQPQAEALRLLIEYYKTGDLVTWDAYNVAWVKATEGDIDYINGFVEVYNDPLGFKGSYENIVEITDFEASARMQVLSENAQWFEDNSSIMEEHKKPNVIGVSYKVVNVAGESGDASPSTPIGVNLPNANWIRSKHGSKSVSLGNIINAYDKASGPGLTQEFAHDQEEIDRAKKYGEIADKLSTALHEVIGHASGQIEPGVGSPSETLKNYRSTLEEARADIIALYYILDPKIVELGLLPSIDAGKAEYDSFISNGLLKQLRRLSPGEDIEESHMRNRQLIAAWAYEKGKDDQVIVQVERDGKIYYDIRDYQKLRLIFGELLREIQRIKSQGDYDACRELVETYAVKVDPAVHQQVLDRTKVLDIPPYGGFVNPKLVPDKDQNDNITDIRITYPDSFIKQMLEYSEHYSFL